MNADRRIARVAGVLFLITFATAIPALYLFQPVLDDPAGYIAGAGADNRIFLGAFLELLLIIANIGTAVVLYPISSGRTTSSLSAMSRLVSLNAPSSLSASSASLRW
ncbi:MAG: DUF4386 family protein [Gaiellaceae bacterium]